MFPLDDDLHKLTRLCCISAPAPSCSTDCWCSSSSGHRPGQRTRRGQDRVYTHTTDLLIWDERLLIIFLCVRMFEGQM